MGHVAAVVCQLCVPDTCNFSMDGKELSQRMNWRDLLKEYAVATMWGHAACASVITARSTRERFDLNGSHMNGA